MDGASLYPIPHISPAVQDKIPPHHFDELTNLTLHSVLIDGSLSFKQKLPDEIDALLDMLPSLQKVLLPAGRFQYDPNETPIERLVRKLLERPSFCPSLQDIGSHEFPTNWPTFLRRLASRCVESLSSSTGRPKSIHTLRFHLLPHPDIVRQLEDAMSGRQLTQHCSIPLCEESCKYSPPPGMLKINQTDPGSVCFMCHSGRLEKGCPYDLEYLDDYLCLRWEDRIEMDSWEMISV